MNYRAVTEHVFVFLAKVLAKSEGKIGLELQKPVKFFNLYHITEQKRVRKHCRILCGPLIMEPPKNHQESTAADLQQKQPNKWYFQPQKLTLCRAGNTVNLISFWMGSSYSIIETDHKLCLWNKQNLCNNPLIHRFLPN